MRMMMRMMRWEGAHARWEYDHAWLRRVRHLVNSSRVLRAGGIPHRILHHEHVKDEGNED